MRTALLVLVVAAASGCSFTGPPLVGGSNALTVRPDERLSLAFPKHPSGEPWRLDMLRGKVVLLDVWATWCDACVDALPIYQDLSKEFSAKGLEVVTINVDADPALITPFMEAHKLDLPVLLDPGAAVSESKLRVKAMPTTFLVDRNGVLRHTHEGYDEGAVSTLLSEVEALLAETPK
ncbi:MAG: TlpA disulfide reductase family protein [Myxococcota bacterium]